MKTKQGYKINLDDITWEDEDHLLFKKDLDVAGNLETPLFLMELGIELNETGEGMLWVLEKVKHRDEIIDGWIKRLENLKDS